MSTKQPPPLTDFDLVNEVRLLRGRLDSFAEERDRERADHREAMAQLHSIIFELQHQIQQQHQRPSHTRPHRPRQYFPRPREAPDTPVNNRYMHNCDELDAAYRYGTSLALPGAKVTFEEHVGDLCEAPQEVKVHAIGNDAWLSRGVAKAVAEKAGRPDYHPHSSPVGHVIKQESTNIGTVYHLVTKENSPDKYHKNPEKFITDVEFAFEQLAVEVKKDGLLDIAMSFLCSGMDRLHRLWVLQKLYLRSGKCQ